MSSYSDVKCIVVLIIVYDHSLPRIVSISLRVFQAYSVASIISFLRMLWMMI